MDRINFRLHYLYWSARTTMLGVMLASLVIWGVTGFDVPEGNTFLIGIQWSTVSTFSLFFYILMVNYDVGGLWSFTQLKNEFVYDFASLLLSFRHLKKSREAYRDLQVVDAVRATAMSALFCISALFLFEAIWVPLYDYFQFGNWEWPVYFAQRTSSLWLTPVFDRNVLVFILPLVYGIMILGLAVEGPDLKKRFRYIFRFDRWFLLILCAAFGMWALWIWFPHSFPNVSSLSSTDIIGQTRSSFSQSNCYVWPSQGLFPQNTNTFYPCGTLGKPYELKAILGFFRPDDWLHLVNVLTKYVTFLAVCYPAMVRVKRNV